MSPRASGRQPVTTGPIPGEDLDRFRPARGRHGYEPTDEPFREPGRSPAAAGSLAPGAREGADRRRARGRGPGAGGLARDAAARRRGDVAPALADRRRPEPGREAAS